MCDPKHAFIIYSHPIRETRFPGDCYNGPLMANISRTVIKIITYYLHGRGIYIIKRFLVKAPGQAIGDGNPFFPPFHGSIAVQNIQASGIHILGKWHGTCPKPTGWITFSIVEPIMWQVFLWICY